MKLKTCALVTINYQRYLVPMNKVQQVVDMIALLQQVRFMSDDDGNSFYEIEDHVNFSIGMLDREVKHKGE